MMGEFEPPYDYPKIKEPSSKPVLSGEGITAGVSTFIELLDTFNDYTGHSLKFLRVSADETRIEVTDIAFESDKNFVHNQPTPSDNWGTINHALDKYPCIQIFNDSGEPARANITHVDTDNVTITSDIAFAGVAYFN
jgi:hypothetical protein